MMGFIQNLQPRARASISAAPRSPVCAGHDVRARTAGFSLVEVMAAILVLGVGIAGLTQGITTALSSSKESERQTTAALIAAGQMEILRADGYLLEGEEEGECGEGLSLYRWKQSITRASIEGLYEVKVVVENRKTQKAIYELQTLLFDPPAESILEEPADPKSGQAPPRKPNRRAR